MGNRAGNEELELNQGAKKVKKHGIGVGLMGLGVVGGLVTG